VGDNIGTDDESELDVQVMSQVADGINLWYWQSPLWLYSMAVDFNNAEDVPDVLSMSWGWNENAQCDIIQCVNITSHDYIRRVNYEYMKILLRGTTIVASSGDAGAPGRTSEDCNVNRPVNAVFPGSSEFVISVGATFVETEYTNLTTVTPLCANHSCVEGSVEHVVNFANVSWTSGGGFSNFTQNTPYWQEHEVDAYLKKTPSLPNATTFNPNGRAYPDISLVGHSCPTYNQGILEGLDGTSCSSPLMGGVVAVINQYQLSKGRNVVGYLNPLLYHIAENCKGCFNDISGGNNWCTEGGCCDNPTQFGYPGIVGFDPVTGLGTPNIGNILSYLDTLFDNKV
jgi:tripeptidyl-peptidase-1